MKKAKIVTKTKTTAQVSLHIPRIALLAALRKAGFALPDHDHIECHVPGLYNNDADIDDADSPLVISYEKTDNTETEEPVTP